jgi:signal transduction histidine kinase
VHTWTMQVWPYRRPACDAALTARVSSQDEAHDIIVEWTLAPRSVPGPMSGTVDPGLRPDAVLRAASPSYDGLDVRTSELEAIRRTYIAALAHELLTPLTVIQGYADTLQSTDAGARPDCVAEAAAAIMDQVTHLRQLATNVLDGARASTGLLTVVQAPVNLPPLVDRALQHFRARTNRHRFIADLPRELPPVLGDHDRLANVLHNLLSNAVKYAPAGGQVWVRATSHVAYVEISVEDEGIGIAPADQASVFEPYYRTGSAIDARIDGVGLGLHICKAIIDAHGGRIWVESDSGSGAAFHFTLPRADEVTPDSSLESRGPESGE